MAGEDKDGLAIARVRAVYLFGFLIAFQLMYGVITQTPIDVAALGLLGGLFTAALGIQALAGVARVLRGKDDNDAA